MSFKITALIDQKLLNISTDGFFLNNIRLCSHMLKSETNIFEISITKDLVIITTEYAVESNSNTANNPTASYKIYTNNINAYDWEGNHLWNIADIVGDLNIPYFGATVTTKKIMREHCGFDELKYDDSCELICCSACNRLYIIDISAQKLIQVLETK
jgi:hypothetical protein